MDITPNANGSGGWQDAAAGQNTSVQTPQPTISNAANAAQAASQLPGIQTAPPAAPAPEPQKHSLLTEILHAVGNALGGGETMKRVNPSTGVIEDVPRSTGSKVGAAISTLARGAAAGAAQHGPGSVGRSALAGVESQDQFQQQQQQHLLQQSQNVRETNAANQQAQLVQASLAKSNQEMVRMGLDIKSAGLKLSADQAAVVNDMQAIRSISGAQFIGHFSTNDEINKYLGDVGTAQSKQHAYDFARNLIRAVPSADGGFDAYQLPKSWEQQSIGEGHTLSVMSTTLGKDGKPAPVWRTIDAPADMTWWNYLTWQGSTLKSSTDNDLQQAQLAREKATTAHEQAETGHVNAETNLVNQQAKALIASQTADPFGYVSPLPQKEALKRQDSFQKDVVNKAYDTEKAFTMSQQAYREYQDAAKQGKELPTGAQSMLLLSQHLGTTFGNVKGSRITKDMIAEHLGARGITDDAVTAVQRIINGDQLSPAQWQAFSGLIAQSRNATWNNAIQNAKNQQIPITFLPRGNGKDAIDAETAKLYLNAAEGDPKKATAAAQKQGWLVQ